MSESYQHSAEIDGKALRKSPTKRPGMAMMASVVFILIGIATLCTGAVLEGAGVLLVAAGCSCIGINPTKR